MNIFKKNNSFLFVIGLFIMFIFINCAATPTRQYNFSLKNTLSIFLLNDKNNYSFAIPIQYIGDYQLENFEFNKGYILIGDYKILITGDDINIDVFVYETSDEYGNIGESYNLNQYNIFIEYPLKNNEMYNIIDEYEKGNTHSQFYLEYNITIDQEQMEGCGYTDDFEFYNGPVEETILFPPNLEFFRATVLEK
jgi:hypothetical protein